MWPFSSSSSNPNFGFQVELVQKLENGNKVFAGYGFRVLEMKSEEGKIVYQLRVKDNLLLEWGLIGTFRSTSEVRRKVAQMDYASEEKSFLSL
jgi:hypothetical protein